MADLDVVIAGGGIAGLTAALTCARLGWNTVVLTGPMLGGHLLSINHIDGFPGFPDGVPGYELCPTIQEQAEDAGATCVSATVAELHREGERWRVISDDGAWTTRALVVASGTTLRQLGVPGEARLFGKGVSRCASCDGPLLQHRAAVVVGGGDSALQEALTLTEFASRVTIVHRGERFSAQAAYQDRVRSHPDIEIRFGTVLDEIVGDDTVTGVRLRETAGGATSDLEVAAAFVFVGLQPETAFLEGHLTLDPSGRIPVDRALRTQLAGMCAAGSVRGGSPGRAVSAAGDGALAAAAVDGYLRDGAWG